MPLKESPKPSCSQVQKNISRIPEYNAKQHIS